MWSILFFALLGSNVKVVDFEEKVFINRLDEFTVLCRVTLTAEGIGEGAFLTSWTYKPAYRVKSIVQDSVVVSWDERSIELDLGSLYDGDTTTVEFGYIATPLKNNIHSTYTVLTFRKPQWMTHRRGTIEIGDSLRLINWPRGSIFDSNKVVLSDTVLSRGAVVAVSLTGASWEYSYSIDVDIKGKGSKAILKITYFPISDGRQSVTEITTSVEPDGRASFVSDKLVVRWQNTSGHKEVKLNAKLKTRVAPAGQASNVARYLRSGRFVRWNQSIRRTASALVKNAKGDFEKARILCDFVHNYLTYRDKDYTGSAPVIWRRKEGSCEHYAILLAAMMRSVGIPARVVNGAAESMQGGVFGPHAWVEAAINGQWLSFDPTWGFSTGLIPLSHIKFYHSTDARRPALSIKSSHGARIGSQWEIKPVERENRSD